MFTEEQLADAKQALEKMENGIRAALPTVERAMREMEKNCFTICSALESCTLTSNTSSIPPADGKDL